MHTSRLAALIIDCQVGSLEMAAQFWSAALGRDLKPPKPSDDRYRGLESAPSEPVVEVQMVTHESRVHLDIESDDIEAEVARLQKLGAKEVERIATWVVMQAPTGQKFCVVKPQRGAMVLNAKTWPSEAVLSFDGGAEHSALQKLIGHYHGETKTWLNADQAPLVSPGELRVQSVFGGRWLRFEQHGSVAGTAHAGEMWLGFHRELSRFELSWIDSFHTGSSMMWSHGMAREDHVIAVTGSYAVGGETWGWRTEFHCGATLLQKAFNISPSGVETPAIETEWTR